MEGKSLELFYRQKKCLTFMGHSFTRHQSRREQILQLIGTLTVLSAQYPMLYYSYFHRNELDMATAALSIDFTNILTTIKICTFLLNKTEFVDIMETLGSMWKDCGRKASEYLEKANVMSDRMVSMYFYSVSCTGIYFMASPLVKIIWLAIKRQAIVRELPMPMKFFFDERQTPGYEFTVFYTGFITLAVVLHAVAIDGFFISFSLHLRSHLRLLQRQIENNSFNGSDNEINYDICSYIDYHSRYLALANKLCKTYKPIVFGQFLMTSLQVCVIVYQLVTHIDNLMTLVTYVTFLTSIMIQLLIYCYGGEILKIESLNVAVSVQMCKWYRLSPKYRKMLCLLMQRSQKCIIIKAGFYEASLANFMVILRAAMSYITLIQAIE